MQKNRGNTKSTKKYCSASNIRTTLSSETHHHIQILLQKYQYCNNNHHFITLHRREPLRNRRSRSGHWHRRHRRCDFNWDLQLFGITWHSFIRWVDLHSASSARIGSALHFPNRHIVSQYKRGSRARVLCFALNLFNINRLSVILVVLHCHSRHSSAVLRREHKSFNWRDLRSQYVEFESKLGIKASASVTAMELETLCRIHQCLYRPFAWMWVRTLEL